MSSLARGLALAILPALAVLLVADAALSYRDARAALDGAHDRALRAALVGLRDAPPALARAALARRLDAAEEDVHVALIGADGRVLGGEPDLPFLAPDAARPFRVRDGHHHGRPVRVAAAFDAAAPAPILVVAESAQRRSAQVYALTRRELALVLAVLLALWLRGARRALRAPALALARRSAEDLTPLPVEKAPRELRPLIEAVNAHLARISGLFEASRRFASDVAHQLRTPLTLLGAQAQYGLRHHDPARLRAAMEEIAAASRAAQRLCNQMLTLSRVEAAHGAIRDGVRVDLAELLRETAFDLGVLALEKEIDLAFDGAGPAPVVGDEIMLHELFSNLIDNALRYTPPGGRVRVSVRARDGRVEAGIADGGPGIPRERRAAVFQRFHRRLDRTGAAGAGLGLAIAHQIALAHGGGIDFADAPDGFVVRVHLPLREAPTPH